MPVLLGLRVYILFCAVTVAAMISVLFRAAAEFVLS